MSTSAVAAAAAAVCGAAHQRLARNGQDAAARWSEARRAVVVVCDGCGSGARSELGAIFTANAMVAAMARQLRAGASAVEEEPWEVARREVTAALRQLLASWRHESYDELALIEQHLLCTVVAAACDERGASVWALGDGAFVLDGALTQLGPFADNAPPYLAYDLLGEPRPAHFHSVRAERGVALVATDGAAALGEDLLALTGHDRYLAHPDALRRYLATLARGSERIAWSERRVERTAAPLQDDASIGLLRWSAS